MVPVISGAAIWKQGSGPEKQKQKQKQKPALRGYGKAWVHLGTPRRLTPGGAPRRRRGSWGGGLLEDSSPGRALCPLPLQGPLPLPQRRRGWGRRVRRPSPLSPRGEEHTGKGGARLGTGRSGGRGSGPGKGGASATPGTAHGRGRGGAAAPVTSLRPPPPGRLLFPFPN